MYYSFNEKTIIRVILIWKNIKMEWIQTPQLFYSDLKIVPL